MASGHCGNSKPLLSVAPPRGRRGLLAGLVALWALALAPEVAHAQKAKLSLERFAFDALPDVKLYLSYVEDDGTVIGGSSVSSSLAMPKSSTLTPSPPGAPACG